MKVPFELQEGENVLLFCRRHWMYFVPKLVGIVLAGLAPIGVFTWLMSATAGLGGKGGLAALGVDVVWAGYWAVRGYFTWYRYQNDVWVVTNQRVVDSVKNNWIHHRMASADLVDIQDMSVNKSGILPTLFNFGDVLCQTAGEKPNFILAAIPDPAKALELVDASRDAARKQLVGTPRHP